MAFFFQIIMVFLYFITDIVLTMDSNLESFQTQSTSIDLLDYIDTSVNYLRELALKIKNSKSYLEYLEYLERKQNDSVSDSEIKIQNLKEEIKKCEAEYNIINKELSETIESVKNSKENEKK